jgi:hypothetical protein
MTTPEEEGIFRARFRAWEADLEEVAKKFYSGERYMLFEAIRRCGQYGIPMPDWIRQEFEAGLRRYNSGGVREFGEAFGIVREKGANLSAIQTRYKLGWDVYQVIEAEKAGGATLAGAFAIAAQRFPMSEGTARSIYYEVREVVEKVRAEFQAKPKRLE